MCKFFEVFVLYGLKQIVVKLFYGLVEVMLFVLIMLMDEVFIVIYVDCDELNNQWFVEVVVDVFNVVVQVFVGKVGVSEWVVIVDVDMVSELLDGQIGEIWLYGNNLGIGYWGKEEEFVQIFKNIFKLWISELCVEGVLDDVLWVCIGDYGIYFKDYFYIVGWIKDFVIIDGCNYYLQDFECMVQELIKVLWVGYVVVFLVLVNQFFQIVFDDLYVGLKFDFEDIFEQLVIVGEWVVGMYKFDYQFIVDDIWVVIVVGYGVIVCDVLLVLVGMIL